MVTAAAGGGYLTTTVQNLSRRAVQQSGFSTIRPMMDFDLNRSNSGPIMLRALARVMQIRRLTVEGRSKIQLVS